MRRLSSAIVFGISMLVLSDARLVALEERRESAQGAENSRLRGFIITLSLGDIQAGPSGTFTPSETKALADLKGFLPYKAYRPLDTAWMIGLRGPHLFLRGVDGPKHELIIGAVAVSPTVTKVDLSLWDATVPDARPATYSKILIDTSFKIEVGETVVVGTSRLEGGKALILLITAAPR